jgi:hypothetical protein
MPELSQRSPEYEAGLLTSHCKVVWEAVLNNARITQASKFISLHLSLRTAVMN